MVEKQSFLEKVEEKVKEFTPHFENIVGFLGESSIINFKTSNKVLTIAILLRELAINMDIYPGPIESYTDRVYWFDGFCKLNNFKCYKNDQRKMIKISKPVFGLFRNRVDATAAMFIVRRYLDNNPEYGKKVKK